MKAPSKKVIIQELRGFRGSPAPPPATEFWGTFRARAQDIPQETPVLQREERAAARWWLGAGGLAGATVVLVLALALEIRAPVPTEPQRLSKVDEVTVHVDYDSMMIVEDAEYEGTVVWIAGVQAGADG